MELIWAFFMIMFNQFSDLNPLPPDLYGSAGDASLQASPSVISFGDVEVGGHGGDGTNDIN